MRIWVRPDRLAQLKLTPGDIVRALNEQNAQFAAGKIGEPPTGGAQELVYTITTKGRLAEPKEFENIIMRANPDGSLLRLKDVARVELGSQGLRRSSARQRQAGDAGRHFPAARRQRARRRPRR